MKEWLVLQTVLIAVRLRINYSEIIVTPNQKTGQYGVKSHQFGITTCNLVL